MAAGEATASVWAGLGHRDSAPPRDEDLDGHPVQRVVPAAAAPAPVSPFDHPFRPAAGSETSSVEPSAAETPEENTVAISTKVRKPRATKAASPRFQMCALLMANGDMSLDELKADVSADKKAFSNALFNAKAAGHVEFVKSTDKYHLTAAGREWASGGANLGNQKASGAAKKPVKKKVGPKAPPKKKPARKTAPQTPRKGHQAPIAATVATTPRSFRCAVYSDGGFFLAKGGAEIELDATEHQQMLHYLERMAEQAVA